MSIHNDAKRSHKHYRYGDKAHRSVKVKSRGGCLTLALVMVAVVIILRGVL